MSLAKFAWLNCGYLILVILFGAWVRITGSGAGCGNHWPMCQGEVLPPDPSTKTLIEFGHRLTSGLCGIFSLILLYRSRRTPSFPWAVATLVFVLLEGFIGAVLVKRELVAGDASVSRAIVISLHLMNTLALMFCATAAAIRATAAAPVLTGISRQALLAGMSLVVLTSMSGAITALGDTLFPTQPAFGPELLAKVKEDISPGQHFLVRLRLIHPLVASLTAATLIAICGLLHRASRNIWAAAGVWLAISQVALGLLNVSLGAPGWMQIVHLALAQVLWLVLVRLLFLLPGHLSRVHFQQVLHAESTRYAVR
jgi:heme A synthase